MQRVVDELPRDLAARVVAAQPCERADGRAQLREDSEVGEAIGIDAYAAGGLVVAQTCREVGKPLERVAHQDPREIVVEVAPVRQLPVGDRDQLRARVHEIAGTGVALHQDDRPLIVVGHLRPQPREREGDHGDAAAGCRVLRLPLDDLVEDVLTDRPRRAELGEVERRAGRGGAASASCSMNCCATASCSSGSAIWAKRLAPVDPRASGTRARSGWAATSAATRIGVGPRARYTAASRGSEYSVFDCGPNPGSERSHSSTTLPSGKCGVDRVPGARRAADATVDGESRRTRHLDDPVFERRVEISHDMGVCRADAPVTRPSTSG